MRYKSLPLSVRHAPSHKVPEPARSRGSISEVIGLLVVISLLLPSSTVATNPFLVADAPAVEGQPLQLSGGGFPARKWIQLTWDASADGMPLVRTENAGDLVATIVPISAGVHEIAAVVADRGNGKRSSEEREVIASVVIAVSPAATPTPTVTPAPTPLPATGASPTPTPTPTPSVTPAPTPLPATGASPTPTPTPSVTPAPTPTPSPRSSATGETCSAEIHATYTAVGPDGKRYPTWHPQRDPQTGCYFGHDHGSDPRLFAATDGYEPAFGYVNHVGHHDEPHNGFKLFLLDDGSGHHWLWTIHLGSSGQNRVCQRFHSVELAVANIATGELLAEIRFLGDFGRSEHNESPFAPLTPANCPTQYQAARDDGSTGARQFGVNAIGADSHQYEPWRLDYARTVFGFSNAAIAFNTRSAMTTCADLNCTDMLPTNHRGAGALRIVQVGPLRLTAPAEAGRFTTDSYGRTRSGTVQQYIKPGMVVTMQQPPTAYNYWPGTDPNIVDYRLRSNDPTVKDGKGDMLAYNVDGRLQLPN